MGRTKKKERGKGFVSLRWTWAATVGFSIFLTFLVFSLVIYGVMRQTLVTQEKNTVTDTVNAVRSRLTPVGQNLTVDAVRPLLDSTVSQNFDQYMVGDRSRRSIFSNSTFEKMSREDINVTVFDKDGRLLFNSRNSPQALVKSDDLTVKTERTGDFDGIIGRVAVISDATGKRIGYVQVANAMHAFHKTMGIISGTISASSAAAFIVSALVGFFLAARFLRPIRRITRTIDKINSEPQSEVRIEQLKHHDELSQLIDEFNGMLDRIQRFMDQQTDFVGDVSHELRTPVAVIEGHLKLLNRWGKDDPEVLDESLNASLQEIDRMKRLIQEMLDLTRADQVDVQFPTAVTDVRAVVTQVVGDMQMIHPDFNITLEDELRGEAWAQIYRNHMEQILIILIDNAIKYSTSRREVHVSIATSHKAIDLAIQDFGEGIAPGDMNRVFHRFYRVDKARSREKGGNGLGLSIAKQLIDGYHGSISVDSVVNSGSVFRISLPLLSPERLLELQHRDDATTPDADAIIADEIKRSEL